MRFEIISIFPDFFAGPFEHGIIRRAREAKLIETRVHDLRQFTHDRHRTVDDRPFGGGEGMVMKPEPLFEAVESLCEGNATAPSSTAIVLVSAAGKMFRQETARRFVKLERMILLCGRYEGVDERVAEHLATDELSIGDFVLSGGELPAAMIVDTVTRLIPGALGNEDSAVNESFSAPPNGLAREPSRSRSEEQESSGGSAASGITGHITQLVSDRGVLDYPHYTRPQIFRGWDVPEVLMSGNHEEIRRWRRQKALEKTLRNRPDLVTKVSVNPEGVKSNPGQTKGLS